MKRFLFICLFFVLANSAQAVVTVAGGHISDLQDGTQLVFNLSAATVPETFLLDNPPRFVIDLRNAAERGIKHQLQSRDVRGIRTGSPNGRDLRIVIDLDAVIKGQVSIVRDAQHRLVIDLFRGQPGVALNNKGESSSDNALSPLPPLLLQSRDELARAEAVRAEAVRAEAAREEILRTEAEKAKRDAETKRLAEAEKAKRAAEAKRLAEAEKAKRAAEAKRLAKAEKAKRDAKTRNKARPVTTVQRKRRPIIIAIDPGHGGHDSGAVGKNGTLEKNVVLQISKRLQQKINREPNLKAFLTRSDDRYLRLYQRVVVSRKKKADIFVSIHANASPNRKPRGASVYLLSNKGKKITKRRFLSEAEKQSALLDKELFIKDRQIRQVVVDMLHDAVQVDSDLMGKKVLQQLKGVGKMHSRRPLHDNFGVLKSPDIPSILVETAFISNPTEEKLLRSRQYQEKLANAILAGIKAYVKERPLLGVELVEGSSTGKQRHKVRRGDTLWEIAKRYRISLDALINANGLNRKNPDLHVGSMLKIPQS